MKKEITQDINRLLSVDGVNVKAIDVVTKVPPEVLIKCISFLIGKYTESNDTKSTK